MAVTSEAIRKQPGLRLEIIRAGFACGMGPAEVARLAGLTGRCVAGHRAKAREFLVGLGLPAPLAKVGRPRKAGERR